MSATAVDNALPLYALTDRGRDGRHRIVQEFVDPNIATAAAKVLRAAGADVNIVSVSSIHNELSVAT